MVQLFEQNLTDLATRMQRAVSELAIERAMWVATLPANVIGDVTSGIDSSTTAINTAITAVQAATTAVATARALIASHG